MNLFSFLLSIVITITPPTSYKCDGDLLKATIRNNLNGDFAQITNLEELDEGAIVVLDGEEINLMLPVSFQAGEISFTDKKWLWSYQDNERGLHETNPRLAHRLPNGEIVEYDCDPFVADDNELS